MATQPLPVFAKDSPNITQTRQVQEDATRWNMIYLWCNAALQGAMGWDGGVSEEDAQGRLKTVVFSNVLDAIQVRVTCTYFDSGPFTGELKTSTVAFCDDGGEFLDVGTWTMQYSATGDITGQTWSNA